MKRYVVVFALFCLSFLQANDAAWERYKTKALRHQHKIMGWCKIEKAEKMMELIHKIKPKICVEIGVFGGSSIYPTAQGLKFNKQGIVYAIDPWTAEACIEGFSEDGANYQWWDMINYEEVYQHFIAMLENYDLTSYCHTLRMSSKEALPYFPDESIDILHVDGNHSEASAYFDVFYYLPKVRPGGYIWFDDANWSQTSKALLYMCENTELLEDWAIGDMECVLFKKSER